MPIWLKTPQKKPEVVAPNLAELCYFWLWDRGFGQQPPSLPVLSVRAHTAPTSLRPTHCWASPWKGRGLRVAGTIAVKTGARVGREGGLLKRGIVHSKAFCGQEKKQMWMTKCICPFKGTVVQSCFSHPIQSTHLRFLCREEVVSIELHGHRYNRILEVSPFLKKPCSCEPEPPPSWSCICCPYHGVSHKQHIWLFVFTIQNKPIMLV